MSVYINLVVDPVADRRQKQRGHGQDELVGPTAGCRPEVQLQYPPSHFPQHRLQQLCSGSKLPGFPQPLRYTCRPQNVILSTVQTHALMLAQVEQRQQDFLNASGNNAGMFEAS